MGRAGRGVRLVLAAIAAGALGASGCASNGGPAPEREVTAVEPSITAFERGHYEHALRLASSQHPFSRGLARDTFALTAGLAAHALDRDEEAIAWLAPVVRSDDRAIAGRAEATLGLIDLERGRYRQAAARLSRASGKLESEQAARASFHAGEAFSLSGQPEAARLHYRLAERGTGRGDVRTLSNDRLSLSGYTVQVGAFSDPDNAERAAATLTRRADALGLGVPVVVRRTSDRGRTLHLVQIGSFGSRGEAEVMRTRLGNDAIVTRAR